jgi:poly(3-hydroxyalkanoate) synthetase
MLSMNDDFTQQMSAFMEHLPAAPRLTADLLDAAMMLTPADNVSGLKDTHNWLSSLNGLMLKNLMGMSRQQADWWSSFGVPQEVLTGWLKPLVQATREAVAAGRDPDPVAVDNLRVESAYAARIKRLVISLTKEVKASREELTQGGDNISRKGYKLTFDRQQCEKVCTTPAGQAWLLGQLMALVQLEWQYHSFGQTRLRALKNLLRSLLQVIAGEVFSDETRQPYRKPSPAGTQRDSDAQYLAECELRLLALLAHDAFDVRRFALESPNARLGACAWDLVPGSELYSVRLRHYPRPEGVAANGKTLYMASPMINRCEIFDLAPGKSVIEGMLALGYDLYMVDYGNPGPDQNHLGLGFYGKTVHDKYLGMIEARHPGQPIDVMAYCMGGTLFMPYLARRIEEARLEGKPVSVRQVVLMTTPILFDDADSGHKAMRDVIREHYTPEVMQTFYGSCNVPPQTIEVGMHAIQPGVAYTVAEGFYGRANFHGAIDDAAPFLHWLHSGTRFPAQAHREWIQKIFLDNEIWLGRYALPSRLPELDGRPVNMDVLDTAGVALFDYRGLRDPIAPVGSCKSSERWGRKEGNLQMTRGGLNRTIEKNVGHIFVVSKMLLGDFLQSVADFLQDEPPAPEPVAAAPMVSSKAEASVAADPAASVPPSSPTASTGKKPAGRRPAAGRKPAAGG